MSFHQINLNISRILYLIWFKIILTNFLLNYLQVSLISLFQMSINFGDIFKIKFQKIGFFFEKF